MNIVRGIGKIFESSINADNILEWINLYAPIYHDVNVINNADDMAFEKGYSISTKRIIRETVTEKFEKLRKRKKRNKIS
jgi:hypothetical protein